jgi:hypothetical protein
MFVDKTKSPSKVAKSKGRLLGLPTNIRFSLSLSTNIRLSCKAMPGKKEGFFVQISYGNKKKFHNINT